MWIVAERRIDVRTCVLLAAADLLHTYFNWCEEEFSCFARAESVKPSIHPEGVQ
jgi:hypothetical protein